MSTWQEIADLFYGEQAEEGMNAFMAQAGQLSALPQAAEIGSSCSLYLFAFSSK